MTDDELKVWALAHAPAGSPLAVGILRLLGQGAPKTDGLAEHRSWRLERISPTTTVMDLDSGLEHSEAGNSALQALVRRGECFRFKLGRGKFYYGSTAQEAISACLSHEKQVLARAPDVVGAPD